MVHPELGGVTGVVAPLVGKEPPDLHVWILFSDVPAFVRFEGSLYDGWPDLEDRARKPPVAGASARALSRPGHYAFAPTLSTG